MKVKKNYASGIDLPKVSRTYTSPLFSGGKEEAEVLFMEMMWPLKVIKEVSYLNSKVQVI